MLSGDPYRVSAEALEECAICFITQDEFFKMIDSNTEFRNEIIRGLSKELGERAVSITDMAQKSVRERIAASLLQLKDIYGDEPINLSREDLANYVGTATETLILKFFVVLPPYPIALAPNPASVQMPTED